MSSATLPPAGPAAPDPAVPGAVAVMAQARHENFPVASRFLPRAERADLLAIYGFARLVDDIGDESAGDRGTLLAWMDAELDRVYDGTPEHPLMRRLAATVHARRIPRDPLDRLVAANRQDQVVDRYATFDDLVAYCHLSADPVGELVLHVFERATPGRIALSNRICTALQVVEHLQDVGEDRAAGRVYLPQADLARHGCPESDLEAPAASAPLRAALAENAARARSLLREGAPLVRTLPPRAALAVAAFVAGGRAALVALARGDHEVLAGRPRPERVDYARALAATLAGVWR